MARAGAHRPHRQGVRAPRRRQHADPVCRKIQRPGQVFTRSLLLATIWAGTRDVYTNVVDLYVSHLRKKLDRAGEPSHIRTVRGIGYAYESRDGAP